MIETGQLAFKQEGGGRPLDPEADVRNLFAADTYEDFLKNVDKANSDKLTSDDLFGAVGSAFGSSPENVRQAVTAKRKAKPSRSS
jgi:hypothetical protein